MTVFRAVYTLYFFILLLIGCATFTESKRGDLFGASSKAYERALLGGKYDAARDFLKGEGSEIVEMSHYAFKKIKVTSYETLSIQKDKNASLVRQTVELRYYFTDSLIERSILDHQVWKYHEEEENWYLGSGLPDFRR